MEIIKSMSKFIGVKMIEAVSMTAREANKTTIGVLTCLTEFEATVSSSCVKPENYDINIGKKYAIEKAKDQIWSGLGFVLQWAINGLKKK